VRAAGDEGAGWRPIGVLTLRGRTRPTEAFVPLAAPLGSDRDRPDHFTAI
jgi:hypothetical protein